MISWQKSASIQPRASLSELGGGSIHFFNSLLRPAASTLKSAPNPFASLGPHADLTLVSNEPFFVSDDEEEEQLPPSRFMKNILPTAPVEPTPSFQPPGRTPAAMPAYEEPLPAYEDPRADERVCWAQHEKYKK